MYVSVSMMGLNMWVHIMRLWVWYVHTCVSEMMAQVGLYVRVHTRDDERLSVNVCA